MNKATKSPLSKLNEMREKKAKKFPSTRTTVEIRTTYKEKLDQIVYWNNSTLKDVLDAILEKVLLEIEPPPIPRSDSKQPLKFFYKKTDKGS
jgi:hypothetical protein